NATTTSHARGDDSLTNGLRSGRRGIQPQQRALLLRLQYDRRTRRADRVDPADPLPKETTQRLGVPDPDLHQETVLARNVMHLLDLRGRREAPRPLRRSDALVRTDEDERQQVVTQCTRVQHRRVAPNDPTLLQLPDPLVDRRGRHPHLACDLRVRCPRVRLEDRQDLPVDVVDHRPSFDTRVKMFRCGTQVKEGSSTKGGAGAKNGRNVEPVGGPRAWAPAARPDPPWRVTGAAGPG